MTTSRNSHTATKLIDGRILVAGGWDGAHALASAEIYDPEPDTWAQIASMTAARAFHTATGLSDGRVLIAGGWDANGAALTTTEIYDPGSGTWIAAASMATGRAAHTATLLPDGRVLVAGGASEGGATSSAELYDPATDSWSPALAMATARFWHSATLLPTGQVLVVGGRETSDVAVAGAELYDPVQNTWNQTDPLGTARMNHTATLLADGRVLVAGGGNAIALQSVEIYDAASGMWTAAGAMTTPRSNHAAVLLPSGQVLVAGGVAEGGTTANAEVYTPELGGWSATDALLAPYESFALSILDDGRVLLTGMPETTAAGAVVPGPSEVSDQGRGLSTSVDPSATPSSKSEYSDAGLGEVASSFTSDSFSGAQMSTASFGSSPDTNYTSGEIVALYGVHEVTFTLPSPAGGNPYATPVMVTFTAMISNAEVITVPAFYDGPQGDRDLWRARVYADELGPWSWAPLTNTNDMSSSSFMVTEVFTSGLHGMLRVSPAEETSPSGLGTSRRWYSDDGHTFMPVADTAYRLFFDTQIESAQNFPATCPVTRTIWDEAQQTTVVITDSEEFVRQYVQDMIDQGINVLRVEALGTWAYEDKDTTVVPPTEDCVTDLSLFWSTDVDGSSSDLFNGAPRIAAMNGATPYYPNRESFERTDRYLKLLLDEYPSIYVQMILVPEPEDTHLGHTWVGISSAFRDQLWQTMVARWAAFPNVFWTVSNDLSDTLANNISMIQEVASCFTPEGSAGDCNGIPDPWSEGRPLSGGHLRNDPDSFVNSPWHSYTTVYSFADPSAQQMDGSLVLPQEWDYRYGAPFYYYSQTLPAFNVEDRYEELYGDNETKEVEYPDYYYRRLFWSHLLSGSGATYGAYVTWTGKAAYQAAVHQTAYTATNEFGDPGDFSLEGLTSIPLINRVLGAQRIDPGLLIADDEIIDSGSGSGTGWSDFNRAQVARRGNEEILAYIPNAVVSQVDPLSRRRTTEYTNTGLISPTITIDLTDFTDPSYLVTWYKPHDDGSGIWYWNDSGANTVTGNVNSQASYTVSLTAPWLYDAVVHITSRCQDSSTCETMDGVPPLVITATNGFKAETTGSATLFTDTLQLASGGTDPGAEASNGNLGAWRCETASIQGATTPSCGVHYDFAETQLGLSFDFYVRRNSFSSSTAAYLMTVDDPWGATVTKTSALVVTLDQYGELHVVTTDGGYIAPIWGVAPDPNRWYHLDIEVQPDPSGGVNVTVSRDGAVVLEDGHLEFEQSVVYFKRALLETEWSTSPDDLQGTGNDYSTWWDELTVKAGASSTSGPAGDPGLYRAIFQQGIDGYTGTNGTWIDGTRTNYNNTALVAVGGNWETKSLLRFDVSAVPEDAVVDEAILQVYYTGRSNGNTIVLGARRVLTDWIDSQATRYDRKSGASWAWPSMLEGTDYRWQSEGTAAVTGNGGAWIDLDVTDMAQVWSSDPTLNRGLVLLMEQRSGYVFYNFCSEIGWSPCSAARAPRLTIRYHLAPPAPTKIVFQQGVNGYTGTHATWFDTGAPYNNAPDLGLGGNDNVKTLLQFDVSSISSAAIVDEATLYLYYTGQTNANTLTVGAHEVFNAWTDSQASYSQRLSGVNWITAGMGEDEDFASVPAGSYAITAGDGPWIEIDVSNVVQDWVDGSTTNHGLVLRQDVASGYVVYDFCSELGWSPCTADRAPKLVVWYR